MEPISMSPDTAGDEPVLTPEVVGGEEGGDKKKWIIIAVVVVILLCCCCLIVVAALSWEGIVDAIDDMMFQVESGLVWLKALTA